MHHNESIDVHTKAERMIKEMFQMGVMRRGID